MKCKVISDKKTGETRIDYYKIKDKRSFRYDLLKKVLYDQQLFIVIDTNLLAEKGRNIDKAKYFEGYFIENKIPYEIIPTENTQHKKIMGFSLKKEVESAYLILFQISVEDYTEDFFEKYLDKCDALYGINPNRSFDEICKDRQRGYITDFFPSEDFEYTLYDSNFIGSMRMRKGLYTPDLLNLEGKK